MAAKMNIARHPIHPMLVAFPIGLWIFSLSCDIIRRAGGTPTWDTVSFYCMGGGIVGAIAAALPGFVDLMYMKEGPARQLGMGHAVLNMGALIVFVADFFIRESAGSGLTPFILSIIGVLIVIGSGWLGGTMIYEYGAAVEPEARIEKSGEEWKKAA